MSKTDWKSYIEVNGYKYPLGCTEETVSFALNYKPLNDDILVITYPKCGTTWTQQIIYLILNNGVHVKNNKDYMLDTYLEFKGENAIRKPVIKTHLPFNLLPLNKFAKYLLVFRNPKDAVVSLYYHIKAVPEFELKLDFHEFFNEWICGQIYYEDYFEHTLHLWNHRFDGNFQYLVYEQMKDNTKKAVQKIAEFLGQEFVDKLKDNNELVLNEVLKYSTTDSMRSDSKNNEFAVRKGIVGDWRNHLNKDESDLIDEKMKKYLSGTELEIIWKDSMKWQ